MKKFKYIICMLLLLVATPIFFTACDSKELANLKTKVETLEAENHTLKTEKADLQSRYDALQIVRIEQEDEIDDLEEEIETLQNQKATQTTLINNLNSQIATLQESQNSLISANTDLTSQLNAKKTELATAQANLAETTEALETKTAELATKQENIVQLEEEIATLESQKAAQVTQITELNEQITTLQESQTALTSENANLTSQLNAKKDELATAQADLAETTESLEIQTAKLTSKQNELTETKALLEEVEAELEEITTENNNLKETTSAMVVYQNKTFDSTAGDNIEVTPVLENDKTYMFVNCTFNNGLVSTAEGIDARFYNCTFGANSEHEKGLYLTSFINLEVVGCQFGGNLGDHFNSSANYGIDLNIYNTSVQNITISYNNFEALTSSTETPCVAISIKVRLGENDNPTEEFWADKTEGSILGTVTIEANTFSNSNNSLYLGTEPKGEDTEANLSSGAFDVIVRNNNTNLNVYERYLYADGIAEAQTVEANANAIFGNKTELPTAPTE